MAISAGSSITAADINNAINGKVNTSTLKYGTMEKSFITFKAYSGIARCYVDVPWTEFGCTASRKACVIFMPGDVFGDSYNQCLYYTIIYGYDDSTATNCRIYIVSRNYQNYGGHRFSYLIWN